MAMIIRLSHVELCASSPRRLRGKACFLRFPIGSLSFVLGPGAGPRRLGRRAVVGQTSHLL